ncbi:hypothetical protein F441_22876 [Phytophthora nicotianae CJ01A1]|uniref:Uncharacterized protein n=1 Tax=Phytophthora nicotianae CJ01A1 TaxID=1317063 RepID=W2VNG1_PHYNI|nr:hypothetical protein F441_22876 [Phytophthora nicotianae CJ01A1]
MLIWECCWTHIKEGQGTVAICTIHLWGYLLNKRLPVWSIVPDDIDDIDGYKHPRHSRTPPGPPSIVTQHIRSRQQRYT